MFSFGVPTRSTWCGKTKNTRAPSERYWGVSGLFLAQQPDAAAGSPIRLGWIARGAHGAVGFALLFLAMLFLFDCVGDTQWRLPWQVNKKTSPPGRILGNFSSEFDAAEAVTWDDWFFFIFE